jgi:dsRNA-specific ribonuclease
MEESEQKVVLGEWKPITSPEAEVAFEKIRSQSSSIKAIEKGIKIYTRDQIKSSQDWSERVKEVATTIMNICRKKPDDSEYENYEEDRARWETCFTKESYSFQDNYEVIEKIGDAVIKLMMLEIVKEQYPKTTPQTLSETTSHLLSKSELSKISATIGWAECVRTGYVLGTYDGIIYRYDKSASEDIFEAVFGTIIDIGNAKQYGIGIIYSRNLMRKLVKKKYFVIEQHASLPPKTAVQQLFKTKGWGEPEVKVTQQGQKYFAILRLTKRARDAIRFHSDTINFTTEDMVAMVESEYPREVIENPAMIELANSDHFGEGSGFSKDDALEAAYANGAQLLRKKNILTNIDAVKGINQFINISLFQPFKKAYLKAKKLGYTNIYISKPRQNNGADHNDYDCQLYGVRGTNVELLITCIIPVEEATTLKNDETRRLVYEAYVNAKWSQVSHSFVLS